MLEKISVIDKIEVLETGTIQVRTANRIMEDGVMLSQSYHRHVVTPVEDYSTQDAKVQAICAATFTPDVIAAYRAMIDASKMVS